MNPVGKSLGIKKDAAAIQKLFDDLAESWNTELETTFGPVLSLCREIEVINELKLLCLMAMNLAPERVRHSSWRDVYQQRAADNVSNILFIEILFYLFGN